MENSTVFYRLQSKHLHSEASADFRLNEKTNTCFRNNLTVSILEAGKTVKGLMPSCRQMRMRQKSETQNNFLDNTFKSCGSSAIEQIRYDG